MYPKLPKARVSYSGVRVCVGGQVCTYSMFICYVDISFFANKVFHCVCMASFSCQVQECHLKEISIHHIKWLWQKSLEYNYVT